MPKLLVLFQSRSPDVIALAEAAVDGARSVRFAEVDLRQLDAGGASAEPVAADTVGRAHRTLGHPDDIAVYDGLILALPVDGADATSMLAETFGARGGTLVNKVGSVLTTASGEERNRVLWAALAAMGDNGMILVPAPVGSAEATAAESARRIGKRVAEVIGWVTHARSHHHHEPAQHGHHAPHQH